MGRFGGGGRHSAVVIVVLGVCFISCTESSIPSISALVAAVAETKNIIHEKNIPYQVPARPSGTFSSPGSPAAAAGWNRPLPSPSLVPTADGGVSGGWSSPVASTGLSPTGSTSLQGWGPPPSPAPPTTTPPPEPETTTTPPPTTTSTAPPTTPGWTPPPPPSGRPIPPWLKCPESDSDHPVYFPHEFSCPYFYQCSHGKPYRLRCRPGLHFNPYYSVCDWPELARCPYEIKDGFIDD